MNGCSASDLNHACTRCTYLIWVVAAKYPVINNDTVFTGCGCIGIFRPMRQSHWGKCETQDLTNLDTKNGQWLNLTDPDIQIMIWIDGIAAAICTVLDLGQEVGTQNIDVE